MLVVFGFPMEGDYIWIEWGLEEQDGENGAMVVRNGAKGLDASVISNFIFHLPQNGPLIPYPRPCPYQ